MKIQTPIQLAFYNSTHFEELNAYQLDETQAQFTASVYESIISKNIESIPGKFPVTILYDEIPVGFFILDHSQEKLIFTEDENSILLRSLSLNPKYQGKGISKQAMILVDDFIKLNFPKISHIVLAVNFKNEHAYQLYLKTGYQNTERVFEGSKGLQRILSKSINR